VQRTREWHPVAATMLHANAAAGREAIAGMPSSQSAPDRSERRHEMLRCCRMFIAGAVLLGATLMFPVPSWAFDLTGAWASQVDLCRQVFTRKDNQIVFTELSDLYGSGFIADSKRIRGKSAQCTIQSQNQDGNNLEIAAACATTIMNQKVKFNLKIIDDDNIDRMFEEIPGMTLRFARCKP
jgi:hypothetical protein